MRRRPQPHRRTPASLLATSLVLALMLVPAACSTNNTYTPETGRYVNESISGQDGIPALFENTPIVVEIQPEDDGTAGVSWTAGCNVMSASTQLRDGRLVVVDDLATTEIGCDEGSRAQDDWLTDFFTSEPLWQQRDDTLVVRSEDLTTTIEFREASSSSLGAERRYLP